MLQRKISSDEKYRTYAEAYAALLPCKMMNQEVKNANRNDVNVEKKIIGSKWNDDLESRVLKGFGGLHWTRTSDPIDVNDVLFQLNHHQQGTAPTKRKDPNHIDSSPFGYVMGLKTPSRSRCGTTHCLTGNHHITDWFSAGRETHRPNR